MSKNIALFFYLKRHKNASLVLIVLKISGRGSAGDTSFRRNFVLVAVLIAPSLNNNLR